MDKEEIRNAVITNARIFIEDHGILTMFLDLDYGGSCQGFGGYRNEDSLGLFVRRILEVLGEYDFERIISKVIRVKIIDGKIIAIGHPLKDEWFVPKTELEEYHKS